MFVARVDRSTDEVRLTDDDAVDDAPCWSPDGTRLAFASERLGNGPRLFLVDAALGSPAQIWNDAADQTDPDWSPAAGRIVFARRGALARFELWTIAPDGTSPIALTDGGAGAGDREPCWSADGSTVVFVRWLDATRSTLARVDVATSQVTLLAAPVTTARFPRFAPRGDRIFFAGSDPSAGVDTLRLWVGRADASEALLLIADDREAVTGLDCAADLPAASTAPRAWSPVRLDGARVSNLQGRRTGGSYDAILAEGGAELAIETVEQGERQIGGLELTVPLGVEPRRVAAIEVTVRAAITDRDPTTRLRATLADYVSERHATHVHATPSSDAFAVWTWRAAGPRCVDRRGDLRVSVVADRAAGGTATLHLDHVGVRVLIESP
ncbi:MAG: PD40 domain-containing protein [Planctomycetes bacterium]|nr:PD40 domain-containing protein [Planctomycetota bacterium]